PSERKHLPELVEDGIALVTPPAMAETTCESGGLPENGMDLKAHLFAIEHRLISDALERSGGTVAHAARLLKLRRTTLVEKLRKYGLAATENLSE
ncbi:MAG: hypothetical protein EBS39_10090, partial [Gammaproteobacteria bacterium]|nr:hypothetical protein [Gammaproteobacteria bacterium]